MDTALQALLSWQFLLFCLSITAFTHVTRLLADYAITNITKVEAKTNHFWTEVILPILPVLLGSSVAMIIVQYPYPEGIVSLGGRFVFGLAAGLLSGLIWRIIKAMLNKKIQIVDNHDEEIKDENK
jgi:hypothetical protein